MSHYQRIWTIVSRKRGLGVSPRFIFLYLCLVRIRKIRTQGEFKISLCNSSGRNLRQSPNFRIRQTSTMELLYENSQRSKHVDCFLQKTPTQTSDLIPNADLTGGAVNVQCRWTASAWKAAGWCTKKCLRFDQTIINLTSGDADCFG